MTAERPGLYGDRARWGLLQADALAAMRLLPEASVGAVVCDPPYGVSMAGWDGGPLAASAGMQAFSRSWATEALRVLRPGGHLVAFAAARTAARVSVGIEEAGFEIRDTLCWLYGSGVPKSGRIGPSAAFATGLKPGYEPIVLARKPLDRATPTAVANLTVHGTGALDVTATELVETTTRGVVRRWPANVLLGGEVAVELDRQHPAIRPSRYFYCAKASRAERERGLGHLAQVAAPVFAGFGQRPRANIHPTVKPLAVMAWLVRLVAPREGVVLDPFCGSGSTGLAALREGRQFIGIEREPRYVTIAAARLRWAASRRAA